MSDEHFRTSCVGKRQTANPLDSVVQGLFGITVLIIVAVSTAVHGSQSTTDQAPTAVPAAPRYTYRIVNRYPHDPKAFTQGLAFQDGRLYEGTGQYGASSLREVDLESGRIVKIHRLPARFFGEGITLCGDRLIQLTWRSQTGFIYDPKRFRLLQEFRYRTEGWGITWDGRDLIMSDGTARLYRLNPETFQEIGRLEVHDGGKPVARLNELEYVRGEIFANIWQSDRIARIDPASGRVTGWIDLAGLPDFKARLQGAGVANGIAYDETNNRLFVTGKRWPTLFEIQVIPAGP